MALSVMAAADVRRFGGLTLVIVLGYVALVAGEAVTLLRGGAEPLIGDLSATLTLLGWMAIDVALIALFTWLWVAAVRGRHGLRYLHPLAFLSLAALADVLIEGKREVVPPRQVARNVDGYLADLRASRKRDVQLALIVLCVWPLLTARPPLPLLAPATRKRFLEKRFLEEDAVPRLVRRYVRVADPHRVADGVSRLLRRPRLVEVDRLHAVPAAPRRPAAEAGRPSPSAVVLAEAAAARALRHRGRRLGRGGRDPRPPFRRDRSRGAGDRARAARRPPRVRRRRGDPVPAALQRGRATARDRLRAPGAPGRVRGRRDDDQQRALHAPARAGARGVGEAWARPRRAEDGDRGASPGARGHSRFRARSPRSPPAASSGRRTIWICRAPWS